MARYTKGGDVVRVPQINAELEKIEQAFENTLSRDGDAPNQMNAPIDMNGNKIVNVQTDITDPNSLVQRSDLYVKSEVDAKDAQAVLDANAFAVNQDNAVLAAAQAYAEELAGEPVNTVRYVQEEVPIAPIISGARWYKPSEGITYVYYVDGDSSQWVQETVNSFEGTLRTELADVNSDVLVGGVEAQELAKIYNSENADVEVLRIPTDYPTLAEACNAAKSDVTQYEILIETGHALTEGLSVVGADFSNITIKSEDATVFLDAGFTGVDVTPYIADYAGIVGETPRPPLFFALYGKLPKLECLIDMAKLYGTGIQLAESDCVVAQDCGVINAGFRGIQVHGRANIYGSNFSGAVGAGIRVQQASSCCANNAVVNDCMSGTDGSEAAIYASRSSTLEFRYGSAQNSGANGLTARRSIVTADDVNVDGASGRGIRAESLAQVSFSNGFARNTLNPSVEAISGANIYAVGSQLSTISAAKQINVDVGGTVHIAGATTVEGVNATEANVFTYSNVRYTNTFDAEGMVFFDSANGTFKITSNANGVSQRFADGRMLTFINTIVDTGTVASGAFSAQLAMPTQPDTFVTVDGSSMGVVGRTSAGGGGNRVAVNNYYRPSVLTGNEFRIQNTGQQLDGAATGLNVQSINLHMITYGTWR